MIVYSIIDTATFSLATHRATALIRGNMPRPEANERIYQTAELGGGEIAELVKGHA
jgi:hypothetical protein